MMPGPWSEDAALSEHQTHDQDYGLATGCVFCVGELEAYSNGYEQWVAQQLEDGADPASLDDEAYADALLSEWEANADDQAWKAGC